MKVSVFLLAAGLSVVLGYVTDAVGKMNSIRAKMIPEEQCM